MLHVFVGMQFMIDVDSIIFTFDNAVFYLTLHAHATNSNQNLILNESS